MTERKKYGITPLSASENEKYISGAADFGAAARHGPGFHTQQIEEFPIIGFYLYHVTSAGQSSNWTTSGIKQHITDR